MSEPFEPSPFMPSVSEAFDNDHEVLTSRQQRGQTDGDALPILPTNMKENSARENNVAKIKVVVCGFCHLTPCVCIYCKYFIKTQFLDNLHWIFSSSSEL